MGSTRTDNVRYGRGTQMSSEVALSPQDAVWSSGERSGGEINCGRLSNRRCGNEVRYQQESGQRIAGNERRGPRNANEQRPRPHRTPCRSCHRKVFHRTKSTAGGSENEYALQTVPLTLDCLQSAKNDRNASGCFSFSVCTRRRH